MYNLNNYLLENKKDLYNLLLKKASELELPKEEYNDAIGFGNFDSFSMFWITYEGDDILFKCRKKYYKKSEDNILTCEFSLLNKDVIFFLIDNIYQNYIIKKVKNIGDGNEYNTLNYSNYIDEFHKKSYVDVVLDINKINLFKKLGLEMIELFLDQINNLSDSKEKKIFIKYVSNDRVTYKFLSELTLISFKEIKRQISQVSRKIKSKYKSKDTSKIDYEFRNKVNSILKQINYNEFAYFIRYGFNSANKKIKYIILKSIFNRSFAKDILSFNSSYDNNIEKVKLEEYCDENGEILIDLELYDLLVYKRTELYTKDSVPPYVVASNNTLINLALYLPKNEEDYLLIKGCGPVSYKKYGHYFVDIINEYLNNK